MDQNLARQLLGQAANHANAGRLADAEATLRQMLALSPNHPELLQQTALLCFRQRKFADAESLIRAAISERSAEPAQLLLAEILRAQNRLPDAEAAIRNVLAKNPNHPAALYNLGVVLRQMNRVDEAIAAYQRAAEINPNDPLILNNLASTLRAQGRLPEAIAYFRKSLAVKPTPETHSNLLYALWFDPTITPETIATEHRRWFIQWAAPLAIEISPCQNNRDPDRQLRVGFVSPDFRQHVIALFMQPILQHHDRAKFHVTCYADVPDPDFMTDRSRASADQWIDSPRLSDSDLAQKIRQNRIDILIDLTAHMAHNRLLVFARKPAPIQISYLAYPATTGLPTINYRLSDPHLDPADAPSIGPEEILRLSETYWCYQPQISAPPVRPRTDSAPLSFACFNHCAKINPQVIALWAEILRQVPNSILQIAAPGGAAANPHFQKTFAQFGIAPDRIRIHAKVGYEQYFSLYHTADIALDPFPYNGGTTTLDALFMGLPVITLAGTSGVSRAGVSILSNAGLAEFIAENPQQYVELTVKLAEDPARLAQLRQSLRPRLEASLLMDAPRFIQNFQATLRQAWREFCRR